MTKQHLLIALFAFLFSPWVAWSKTIGVLVEADTEFYATSHRAFVNAVRERHKDAWVILQKPKPTTMAWINTARRFESLNVNLVVVYGATATRLTVEETHEIPVVWVAAAWSGLSLPPTRATGVSWRAPFAEATRYLRALRPFSRLGVFHGAREIDAAAQLEQVAELGRKGSFGVFGIPIDSRGFDAGTLKGADAVLVASSSITTKNIGSIAQATRERRILSGAVISGGEQAGVILTVTPNAATVGRQTADVALQLLNGNKPQNIPRVAVDAFEITVNVRAAAEIGLVPPPQVVSSATRVIK